MYNANSTTLLFERYTRSERLIAYTVSSPVLLASNIHVTSSNLPLSKFQAFDEHLVSFNVCFIRVRLYACRQSGRFVVFTDVVAR